MVDNSLEEEWNEIHLSIFCNKWVLVQNTNKQFRSKELLSKITSFSIPFYRPNSAIIVRYFSKHSDDILEFCCDTYMTSQISHVSLKYVRHFSVIPSKICRNPFFLRSDFCQNLIYYFIGTAMIEVFPPKAVLRKSRKFPNVISSFHALRSTIFPFS